MEQSKIDHAGVPLWLTLTSSVSRLGCPQTSSESKQRVLNCREKQKRCCVRKANRFGLGVRKHVLQHERNSLLTLANGDAIAPGRRGGGWKEAGTPPFCLLSSHPATHRDASAPFTQADAPPTNRHRFDVGSPPKWMLIPKIVHVKKSLRHSNK